MTTIKLQQGGSYITRAGGVFAGLYEPIPQIFRAPGSNKQWREDGTFITPHMGVLDAPSKWDLVEEVRMGELEFSDVSTGEADRTKQHLTDEALRITSGARRAAYGPPENNFERIARFWQAYMQNTGRDVTINAADVSPMMRLMKEARLCETPDHLDSFVDLVGYTLTGAEVNGVKVG